MLASLWKIKQYCWRCQWWCGYFGTAFTGSDPNRCSPILHFPMSPCLWCKNSISIPLALGYDIVEKAKAQQNGQGKCLKYIMSHQSGKIEITGKIDDTHLMMKYHQSKDPSQYGITYIKELPVDETCWKKIIYKE